MLRICALNEEDSSESGDGIDEPIRTKEAEESEALNLYKEGLALRQRKEFQAALETFHRTLGLPYVEDAINENDEKDGQAFLPQALQLKYACLKNIGDILLKQEMHHDALIAYLEAVEVDPMDVTVWYNIGEIAVRLNNLRLARHAFEQGLVCSPSHWPCLDELIGILFAICDDVACLHHISLALSKDPYFIKGIVLRDAIFEETPSLKTDVRSLSDGDWNPLFSTVPYDLSEKERFIMEAMKLREAQASLYKPKDLPPVSLVSKVEPLTWEMLGSCLIDTYNWMTEQPSVKLSSKVELDFQSSAPEPHKEEEDVTAMEVDGNDAGEIPSETDREIPEPAMEIERVEENKPIETEQPIEDAEHGPVSNGESAAKSDSNKSDSCKRKRSTEVQPHPPIHELRDVQRRSTRSRACAQRTEEDIDSLRAELRSYLPTSLLLGDSDDSTPKIPPSTLEKTAGELKNASQETPAPDDRYSEIPDDQEKKDVSNFIQMHGTGCPVIVDLLNSFCLCLTKLDHFTWSTQLSAVFEKAYQLTRTHCQLPNVFHSEGRFRDEGLKVLIHAEILVGALVQPGEAKPIIPEWFSEDLTQLLQLAEENPSVFERLVDFFVFQARVFWLHCHWNYSQGRVEGALNYLEKVKGSLLLIQSEESGNSPVGFPTRISERLKLVRPSDVNQLCDVVLRILQLEDVEELHKQKRFRDVVVILQSTFNAPSGHVLVTPQDRVPVDRPTQLKMFIEGLTHLGDFDQYLIWVELCLDESLSQYLAAFNRKTGETHLPSDDSQLSTWASLIESILGELEEIFRFKRSSLDILSQSSLSRFAENLVLICAHQLEVTETNPTRMPLGSPVCWILLHRAIEFQEKRQSLSQNDESPKENQADEQDEDEDESLPCSILFLISAHDLLGKRSWCMNKEGVFVTYALEVLVRKLRTVHDGDQREELGRAIEQASFCACAYPSAIPGTKKSKPRSTVVTEDHGGTSVPLNWKRALLLAQYFLPAPPQELPEFDTVNTCTAEQEVLLKKIVSLIPAELDPKNRLDDIQDFVQGRKPNIATYLKHNCLPDEVKNVFYLLGDYYFKNKDWAKAIENYLLDLALNPDRFDSWAALALASGSRLETKLNSCDRLRNVATFLDRAESALRCFRRALRLRPLQTTLWIEHGSTAYMLHSFCGRLLHQQTDSLSLELFQRLENEKERMLDIAHDCFRTADKAWMTQVQRHGSGVDQDERWLHHYMLGKIAEKRTRPVSEYLDHYQKAALLLEEASAAYPRRISYNTPPQLSVEALEIHYRIHSCILKTLLAHEGRQLDASLLQVLQRHLSAAADSLFTKGGRRSSVEEQQNTPGDTESAPNKRKANSKHEDEQSAKRQAIEPVQQTEGTFDAGRPHQLEGRAGAIFDVHYILAEIFEHVITVGKAPVVASVKTEPAAHEPESVAESSVPCPPVSPPPVKAAVRSDSASSSDSSSSSSSSDSDSDSSSSSSESEEDGQKPNLETAATVPESQKVEETAIEIVAEPEPTPDVGPMIDQCLSAIKECVSRFPHFYKGHYRLSHYYFHSKSSHNIEACRELLFGRPLSAAIAQMQQQQGISQPRYLPVGVAGLFAEWRSNNFFQGIWRIPVNEIDRPGCFAAHMGRSVALLLDVLKESKDHRLLMELTLALHPEPEADKKYLFDPEREQHAALALSLMLQVLRARLQEVKEASSASTVEDSLNISPNAPSSSRKLSLLMDVFRAHDRIERNLPGQENAFVTLLVECYKVYRGPKPDQTGDGNENAKLLEQALAFCKSKQAQSRVRIGPGNIRGGLSSSLGVASVRGKRGMSAGRRGRPSLLKNVPLPQSVREQAPLSKSGHHLSSTSAQNAANQSAIIQEAMKLLKSSGGSAANLPQHLRNIPRISSLLALFPNAGGATGPKASTSGASSAGGSTSSKRDSSLNNKAADSSRASSNSASEQFAKSLGASSLLSNPSALGLVDASMLAAISNPFANPVTAMAMGLSDPSTVAKMQAEYQQQVSNWMQATLAQSYLMSGINPAFYAARSNRGRPTKKPVVGRGSSAPLPPTSLSSSIAPPKSTSSVHSTKPHLSKTTSSLDLKLPTPTPKTSGPSTSQIRSAASVDSGLKLPPSVTKTPVKSSTEALLRTQQQQSLDLSKMLAGLPPLDLARLTGQRNLVHKPSQQSSSSLISDRTKLNTKPATAPTSKPGSAGVSAFPLNLGRDITVIPASASKNEPKNKSSGPTNYGQLASTLAAFQSQGHVLSKTHHSDPAESSRGHGDAQNLAFSVLKNLPPSMSLLVNKPSSAAQSVSRPPKAHTTALEVIVNHKHSQSSSSASSMPKLTPAPGKSQMSSVSKKGKSLAPPGGLSTLPPLTHSSHPISLIKKGASSTTSAAQRRDSGDDSDVVILD